MFHEFRKHIPSLSSWIEACYSTDRVVQNVNSPEVASSFQQMVVPNGETASSCGESKSTAIQLTNNLLFDLDWLAPLDLD